MRASFLKLLAVLCLGCGGFATSPCRAQDKPLLIEIEADSTEIDYARKIQTLRNPRVTRGDIKVQADLATGSSDPEDDNSVWNFSGNVIITTSKGNLRAEKAEVVFRNNRIATATISGADTPATFEQKLDDKDAMVRGRAGTIEYDVAAERVQLKGNAWLTDGRNDIRGESVVYSIRDEKAVFNPKEQGKDRVRIIINPNAPKAPPRQ